MRRRAGLRERQPGPGLARVGLPGGERADHCEGLDFRRSRAMVQASLGARASPGEVAERHPLNLIRFAPA